MFPMSVGVIVAAGGRGARLGSASPKQFLVLGGRPMLARSVSVFDAHPRVTEIVVHDPISTDGLSRKDTRDLAERVRSIIGSRLPAAA